MRRPASSAPQLTRLRCEELGEEKDFTPEHAAALLARQKAKGRTDWQPVAPAASAPADPSTPADAPRNRRRTRKTQSPG